MKKIIIFASGSGSNAENIISYFSSNKEVAFPCILSNKADAYVKVRAEKLGVPFKYFTKEEWKNGDILRFLKEENADLIVLAGFLLKVPEDIIKAFPNKIINIHPSLLPKHGGKGMYGMNVHRAVVENHEKETGATLHFVNEEYEQPQLEHEILLVVHWHNQCLLAGELHFELVGRLDIVDFERTVKVGNCASGSAFDRHRGSRERLPCFIFEHHTLNLTGLGRKRKRQHQEKKNSCKKSLGHRLKLYFIWWLSSFYAFLQYAD